MSVPVVETTRLRLSRLSPEADDDADFVLRQLNDPGFIRFIADRGVRSLDDARAYIRNGPATSYARHGHGLYRVSLKDGTPVGLCGLLIDPCPRPQRRSWTRRTWVIRCLANSPAAAMPPKPRPRC